MQNELAGEVIAELIEQHDGERNRLVKERASYRATRSEFQNWITDCANDSRD
jgi:hypothetical protein